MSPCNVDTVLILAGLLVNIVVFLLALVSNRVRLEGRLATCEAQLHTVLRKLDMDPKEVRKEDRYRQQFDDESG